jgi:hypothetical protein
VASLTYLNLNDPQELMTLLQRSNKDEKDEGEILISASGIKVEYHLDTGKVRLKNISQISRVTNLYSRSAFASIIAPLEDAISLYAKVDFLKKLEPLVGTEVFGIFESRHVNKTNNLMRITHTDLENTFLKILNRLLPTPFLQSFTSENQKRKTNFFQKFSSLKSLNEGIQLMKEMREMKEIKVRDVKRPSYR